MVLLLLLVVLVTGFLLRQRIGRYVLARTMVALGRAVHGSATYSSVGGDIFSNPRLYDVEIIAEGYSVRVREVSIAYDLWQLAQGRIMLSELQIVDPCLWIASRRTTTRQDSAWSGFPNLAIQRLEVVGGRVFLDTTPRVDSLNMTLVLRSRREQMQVALRDAACHLTAERLKVRSLTGIASVTRDSVIVDSIELRTAASRLSGCLRLASRSGGVTLEVSNLRAELAEFGFGRGRVWLSGSARAAGSTQEVRADYRADGLVWHGLELPALHGSIRLEDSVASLDVAGSDPELGAARIAARLRLGEWSTSGTAALTNLAVHRLDSALPAFRLDAAVSFAGTLGSLRRSGEYDSLEVALAGRVPELGVDTITAAGGYVAGATELRYLRVRGSSGEMEFTGKMGRGSVLATCQAAGFDLALASRFAPLLMAGRVSGSLLVSGAADSWYLRGRLRAESLLVGGVQATRALVEVDLLAREGYSGRIAAGGEDLIAGGVGLSAAQLIWTGPQFEVRLEQPENRLLVSGNADYVSGALVAEVGRVEFATSAETLVVTDSFAIRWRGDSLTVGMAHIRVADGSIEASARLCASRAPSYCIRGRNLNLRKLQRLLRSDVEMWGDVGFEILGGDTIHAALTADLVQFPTADISLKRVDASLALVSDRLFVDRISFVHGVDTSLVTGVINYAFGESLTVTEFDLDITAADPGTWIFGFLKGTVDVTDGLVYGHVRLSGSPERPALDGRARIVRATVTVPSANSTVERANAEMTFQGDRVMLDKLSGESGKGTVIVNGLADLGNRFVPDSVRFRIRADGASANPIPDFYGIGDADLLLRWAPGRPVELTGDVAVEEGVVTMGFGGNGAPPTPDNDSFTYDLRVRGDRGIWLRNREADIELGVDLTLRKTMTEMVYTGRLESRQGSVYYLDRTLRVAKGVLTFRNVSSFNPDLDIVAELPVRPVAGQDTRDWPERLIVTLTGTLSEPVFKLNSEPAIWDENQIAGYLSFSAPVDELPPLQQKDQITRLLSERLLGYFQTQVTKRVREFVALDYLEFDAGIVSGHGARVTVGKYVGRKLYVTYTQNFAGEYQPSFQVEYYLNRQNELLAQRSDQGTYSLRYRYKLRY